MSRTLPARPSLIQLKHQAKDLRIASRQGDPEAIAILRSLRRLRSLDDEAIRRDRVSLSEAQLALALSYGYRSWAALKADVAAADSGEDRALRQADGARIIAGFEDARWGGGTGRACSTIATLSLISERIENETDYDYLMGASGAAFRVQMSEGQLCPSSPHAACGFDCAELAVNAWGNEVTFIATGDADSANRDRAREAIIASLEKGVPALYEIEESHLIVGHTDQHLLLRPHAAQRSGYEAMESWPWYVGIVATRRAKPDARAVLSDSLKLAMQLFETESVRGYRTGRAAYAHWRTLLGDERAFEQKSDRELFVSALGNGHSFFCLADARGAAANYLASMLEHAPSAARPSLEAAVEAYTDIERSVSERPREVGAYPWQLAKLHDWSADLRRREIALLDDIAIREERAIAQLRLAAEHLA